MTALRSRGVPLNDAACIASAIGAVFCEYKHIPPWSSNALARVRQAAEEVKRNMKVDNQLLKTLFSLLRCLLLSIDLDCTVTRTVL
jgi:hypothetical protein